MNNEYIILSDSVDSKNKDFLSHFLHGLKLKSYAFKKYKSKNNTRSITLNIAGIKNQPTSKSKLKFKALEEGTFYTRDLVSEPGNILHPDEYAKRLQSLKKVGLKVTVFNEKEVKKTWHAFFTWGGHG